MSKIREILEKYAGNEHITFGSQGQSFEWYMITKLDFDKLEKELEEHLFNVCASTQPIVKDTDKLVTEFE